MKRRSPWSIDPEMVRRYREQRAETLLKVATGEPDQRHWLIRAAITLADECVRADDARRARKYRMARSEAA